ncbi:MAG: hypothetical protein U1C53_02350, partial [Candidatus Veblenbacteria bacterium]|nr:hypothetical protein [Candidatus Veblenbacteria bacterium]
MNNITLTLRRASAIVGILALVISLPGISFAQYDYGYDTGGYDYGYDTGGYDYGYDTGGYDYGYDTGGYDYGYDTGGYDYGYDTGGYDYGYDTGGYDYGYDTGGYDYGYDTGGYDYGYDTGGYDYGYDTGGYDYGYDTGGYDYGYDTGGYDYGYDTGGYDYGYDTGGYDYGYDTAIYNYGADYGYDYGYDYGTDYGYDAPCYSCGSTSYADYSADYYGGYDYGNSYGYTQPAPQQSAPQTVVVGGNSYPSRSTSSSYSNSSAQGGNAVVSGSGNSSNIIVIGGSATPGAVNTSSSGDTTTQATLSTETEVRNITDGTTYGISADVDPSEVVSVSVAYRNTSNVAIQNLRLSLGASNSIGSITRRFTGSASADNASTNSDYADVYVSDSVLALNQISGQIFWYPNGGSSTQSFPNGVNGSSIIGGTLNLGTINPGQYGFVEVHYRLDNSNNNGGGNNNNNNQSVSVTTNVANNISEYGATLNGYVATSNYNASTRFEYGTTQSFGNTTSYQNYSGSQNFSSVISGLTSNTTYYYRAVSSGPNGNVYGNSLSFTTSNINNNNNNNSAPTVSTQQATRTGNYSTSILNGYLGSAGGQNTATTYFEYGTTQSFGSRTNSRSTSVGNFSDTVSGLSSANTYYYRAVATNSYGTVYGNTLSFVSESNYVNVNNSTQGAPSVTTYSATLLGSNNARLNGFANRGDSNSVLSAGWFEWGSTINLGSRTSDISLSDPASSSFFDTLSGLVPNTTYYYRAVAGTTGGYQGRGATVSFTTNSGGIVSTGGPSVVAGSGVGARITKTVENRSFPNGTDTEIAAWGGNTIEFEIRVTNTGSVRLNDLIIHDRIPDSLILNDIDDGGRQVGNEVEWRTDIAVGATEVFTYRAVGKHLSDNVVIERSADIKNAQISRRSNSVLIILNK